jgi:hypothetical protein
MLQGIIGILIVLHGLVTAAIGAGTLANGPGVPNPPWLGWWPTALGRSWLVDALPGGAAVPALGGALWIAAGLAVAGAGLGWLGAPLLRDEWATAAALGAGLGLAALALYFHPYYALGTLLNLALLALAAGALRPAAGLDPAYQRAGHAWVRGSPARRERPCDPAARLG